MKGMNGRYMDSEIGNNLSESRTRDWRGNVDAGETVFSFSGFKDERACGATRRNLPFWLVQKLFRMKTALGFHTKHNET